MCRVVALQHFVLFHGLKNERSIHYTGVLSLFHIACVASVSSRVIARKLEREQKKKKWKGKGEGRRGNFPSLPSPSPLIPFFLLSSQLSRRTRAEMLAMQALFHRALVSFHGFSVFASTRGFKRASLKFDSSFNRTRGTQGFKNELCYVCGVLVST